MTTIDDFDVRVLRLQPGDVVVLKASRPVTHDQATNLRERWKANFPNIPVVVLDDLFDISIVRPEPA